MFEKYSQAVPKRGNRGQREPGCRLGGDGQVGWAGGWAYGLGRLG